MSGIANAHRSLAAVSLLAIVLIMSATTAQAQASSFTYQGRLTEGAKPADGLYDMQFKLSTLLR